MNPLVIGCIVHDRIRSAPEDHFKNCIASFLTGVLGADDVPKLDGSGVIFAESYSYDVDEFGSMVRFRLSTEEVALVRQMFQDENHSDDDSAESDPQPQLFLAIGSQRFCTSVLEYLFIDGSGEVHEEGREMIALVTRQSTGAVVVSKDGVDGFIIDDLAKMYERTRTASGQ